MKTLTFKRLLLPLFFTIAVSAFNQTVSIPPIADFNHNDFGTEITIPVNIEDIQSVIGDLVGGNITIEYNRYILEYVSYNNLMNPGIFEGVNSAVPGVLTFAWFDDDFNAHTFPNGKLVDITFKYFGGATDLTFTDIAWFDEDADDWTLTGGVTGNRFTFASSSSISGFADLTSNAAGGAWENKLTWIENVFGSLTQPGPGHNITIQSGGTITINTAEAKANSITVASGGQLTQQSGDLKVVDFLKISSGGSFIQNGTITCGDVSVDRYIVGGNWATSNDGWHLLSSPMTAQAISGGFTPDPSTSYDFYGWDEDDQTWRNFKGANFAPWNGGTNFIPGRGYLVAYQNTDTKTFAGTLNSENVNIPVVRGGSGVYMGYNLVGNPFPSAISWNTGDWSLGNIGGVAHVWDRTAKAYVELDSPGDLIPAMNGFMVYLSNSATTSLTIPKAARTYGGTNWYKSTDERIVLVAHSVAEGSAQRTVIRFDAEASEDFDLAYDGYFLQGYAPKFYSKSNNLMFSVNTLPQIVPDMEIPLGFVKTSAENFYIELEETLNNELVYLTDTKTNTTVILTPGAHYQFTATEGDSPDRFLIHFNPVGNTELAELLPIAFARGENLVVRDLKTKTRVELYNQMGQLIHSSMTNASGTQEIGLNLSEGIYIVRLSNGNQTTSTKVFLQ